jgi:hypothetical protein
LDPIVTAAFSALVINGMGIVIGVLWKFRSEALRIQQSFTLIAAQKQTVCDTETIDASANVFSRMKDMKREGSRLVLDEEDRKSLTKIVITAANLKIVGKEVSKTTEHFTNSLISGACFIFLVAFWCLASLGQGIYSGSSLTFILAGLAFLAAGVVVLWGLFSISNVGRFRKMNTELETAESVEQIDPILESVLKELGVYHINV